MSTKRILGITIFGLLLIATAIGAMLLTSTMRRESAAVALPETPPIAERPGSAEPDALVRIEVNRETVQDVVSTLFRPDIYSREVTTESFWEGGQSVFTTQVNVKGEVTALIIAPPDGPKKRIIVTPDFLYIWHDGDDAPYIGRPYSLGYGGRTADEWHMLLTFENILGLSRNDIIDAGVTQRDGKDCVFAVYRSPILGSSRKYFISLDFGLVVAAYEHDSGGMLIYRMTAGETTIGEVNPEAFALPGGTVVAS